VHVGGEYATKYAKETTDPHQSVQDALSEGVGRGSDGVADGTGTAAEQFKMTLEVGDVVPHATVKALLDLLDCEYFASQWLPIERLIMRRYPLVFFSSCLFVHGHHCYRTHTRARAR
jgi:hypothetical protein